MGAPIGARKRPHRSTRHLAGRRGKCARAHEPADVPDRGDAKVVMPNSPRPLAALSVGARGTLSSIPLHSSIRCVPAMPPRYEGASLHFQHPKLGADTRPLWPRSQAPPFGPDRQPPPSELMTGLLLPPRPMNCAKTQPARQPSMETCRTTKAVSDGRWLQIDQEHPRFH